jgi:Uma2 family endonuclease
MRLHEHGASDSRKIEVVKSDSLKDIRHVRPVQPLLFPESKPEWDLGQSTLHDVLCTLLKLILRHALGAAHTAGADQFVYWDASDPEICLAPDAFVKLGVPFEHFKSWKTWEKGTPELAVEILSSDTPERLTFKQKLDRYRALGVSELITYEPEHRRIRAWDRIQDDLVERVVDGETTPCVTLNLHFVIAPGMDVAAALRVARDPEGLALLPTPEEEERAAKEHERAAKEQERAAKEQERAAKERERAAKEQERAAKEQERAAKEEALREVERLRALVEKK